MTKHSIPRGLKNQARFWLETYHGCAEKTRAWEEVKSTFMRGNFSFSFIFFLVFAFVLSNVAVHCRGGIKELSLYGTKSRFVSPETQQ